MKKFFLASIVVDPVLFFFSFLFLSFLEDSNSSDTGKISSNLLYTYGDKISLRRSWKVSQGQMDKFRRRCGSCLKWCVEKRKFLFLLLAIICNSLIWKRFKVFVNDPFHNRSITNNNHVDLSSANEQRKVDEDFWGLIH